MEKLFKQFATVQLFPVVHINVFIDFLPDNLRKVFVTGWKRRFSLNNLRGHCIVNVNSD